MTRLQKQTFDFVKAFISDNGYSPTYAEIGEERGVYDTTARYHIDALIKLGRLRRNPEKWRGIELAQ